VDISATVCLFFCNFLCVFVRLRITLPRIKLAASNFAGRFIGVQFRGCHIFGNFSSPEAQNQTNRLARSCCNVMLLGFCDSHPIKFARRVDVESACVDICQSPKTDVLVAYCGIEWLELLTCLTYEIEMIMQPTLVYVTI